MPWSARGRQIQPPCDPVGRHGQVSAGHPGSEPFSGHGTRSEAAAVRRDREGYAVGVLPRGRRYEGCGSGITRRGGHRPEQAHTVRVLVRAGSRTRLVQVDGTVGVRPVGGLSAPGNAPAVHRPRGDRDVLAGRQPADPRVDRFVRQRHRSADVQHCVAAGGGASGSAAAHEDEHRHDTRPARYAIPQGAASFRIHRVAGARRDSATPLQVSERLLSRVDCRPVGVAPSAERGDHELKVAKCQLTCWRVELGQLPTG